MASEDPSTQAGSRTSGPASWRQGRRADVEPRTEYRWQQRTQAAERRPVFTRRRIWNAAWVLATVGLLAALLAALLFAPRRTPLVAVAAVYDENLPPNAWVQEDLEALRQLDRSTLRVHGTLDDWTSRERGLRVLDEHLRRVAAGLRADEPLLLYVNLHGAVDGTGVPCLIPPGAAAEQSDSWLPVQTLLERLKDPALLPAEVRKLVLLDCTRLRVHWSAGILDNTFAARLPEAVRRAAVPNLAVLCATSPGETSCVSPGLSGSVFGHFLRLALAGEANGVLPGGKSDGRVSLHELHAYLGDQVDRWARRHCGQSQRPLLLPAEAPDFPLCLALKPRELRSFREGLAQPSRTDGPTRADIDALWRRHDELLAQAPYRQDPLAWHRFERRLLWLEQASVAGDAYAGATHSLTNQLKRDTSDASRDSAGAAPVRQVFDAGLARSLGMLDDPTASRLRELLTQFEEQPGAASLQAALAGWPVEGPAAQFSQRHFLRMLQRYEDPGWWQQPDAIRRALSLRAQAAELGAPRDASLFYWLRARSQAGDAARQTGEDCLLAGDSSSIAPRDAAWTEAEGHYQVAGDIAALVGQASRIRDQVYAQLPSLAQWLCRPDAAEPSEARLDHQQRLIALIEQVHQLSEALDQHPATAGESALGQPGLGGLAEQVARELERLGETILARGRQLGDLDPTSSEVDPAAVRDLEALLQLPLVPAPVRSRLRDRLTALTATAASNQGEAGSQRDGEPTAPPLTNHPLLKILRLAGPTEPPAESGKLGTPSAEIRDALSDAERQGEQVRQCLQSLAAQNQSQLTQRLAVADDRESAAAGTEHLPARTALSQAACQVRAAAPLGLPRLEPDPIAMLADFDLQQLLLWHAQRAVADFWGPAGDGEPAYFELAAAGYVQAADQVLPRHPTTQRQFDRLQASLEQARSAARSGIAITATDLLLVKDDEPGSGAIDVRRPDDARAGMPAGRLGVWFRDQTGRIAASARTVPTADLTATADKISYALPGETLAGRGPQLQAVAMLRGHEFTTPSLLRLLAGATVDFRPRQDTTATVTLYGGRRKEASTLFILDCSHSMNAAQTVEAPVEGLPEAVTTRMEVAKFALQSMLDRLAREDGKRVGVRFYGHRVGWNIEQPTEMLPQVDYARPIPTDLLPADDVELVLPLGRFDSVAAGQVRRLLTSVKPWGETPLYLAMVQAVRDFALDKPGTEKSLVVITDGVNNQFNPSPESAKTRQDVLQERGAAPIRIHIVGFGISAAEQAEAVSEFEALAAETDGSFHQATSVGALLSQLESLLGYGAYAVLDAHDREIATAPVDVPVQLDTPRQTEPFQLAWEQLREPLALSGGEAAELEIDATGRFLLSLPYEVGAPVFRPLVAGAQETQARLNFGVHQPIRLENQVRLPFSFQREDRHFTPRPAEVWIEVTPRSSDRLRTFPAFLFYDAEYVGQKRVPLLEWTADRWPAAADRAEVRVFAKATKTQATAVVPLADVADRTPASGEGHVVDSIPGFTYQVRTRRDVDGFPLRIRLLERHAADSSGVGAVKVEVVPAPQRIIRQFDAENGLVLHTFYFGGLDRAVLDAAQIHFTTRKALETDAWMIAQPVSVPVAASRDVLEVVPATLQGPPAK